VKGRHLTKQFQIAGIRRDTSHIPGNRLDDNTGNLAALFLENGSESLFVVEANDHRIAGEVG